MHGHQIEPIADHASRAAGSALRTLLLAAYGVLLLRTAWDGDDAWITYRSVENWVQGRGLTWNPGQRVQVFTHPLWMLIVAGCHRLTGEFFFTVKALSIALSLAAAAIVSRLVLRELGAACLALAVFLLSKSYVDYSTSGLENPLTHLLLAWGAAEALRTTPRGASLAACCGLALLNRMDCGLLFLPLLARLAWRSAPARSTAWVLAAFAPLALWLAFATFYFGAPLPNSAYAKLNHDVPRAAVVAQGGEYALDLLRRDPLAATVLLAGFALAWRDASAGRRALLRGAALYCAYVLWIGGDFMAGRMFSAPLLAATIALAHRLSESPRLAWAGLATAAAVGLASPGTPMRTGQHFGERLDFVPENGIADERAFYYRFTSLLAYDGRRTLPDHPLAQAGHELAQRAGGERRVVAHENMGFLAYFAGPNVHVVDRLALTDPFLARLPPAVEPRWRPGHLRRELPARYLETLESGANRLQSPELAAAYERVRLLTTGPLWSRERWRALFAE